VFYSSPEVFFSELPGYGMQTRLNSTGVYLDLDLMRREYQWGSAAHFGASYQDGIGRSMLSYFAYETQLEGRLPVVPENSVLVGQANIELNRERGGSSPIPFYLLPHIGGSSTLRGFALDRFYGRNLMLLSLEYRYRMHPNIQAIPFFDEGQIFDRTEDLTWLNWHRNFGLGFRFRSPTGTFLRIEYGRSREGFQLHITFGDRERPPLRGPVRYGAYKR
jgi:outer membrane translocation and assembly module TamA